MIRLLILASLFASSVFALPGDRAQTQTKFLLVNGADYETVFEFNYSGVSSPYRSFVVPRDASIEVTFPTSPSSVRCVVKRGDNGNVIYTGVYKVLSWTNTYFYGITQQSTSAFTGYESANPREEIQVWADGPVNVWVANTDYATPIDVNVVAGGGGASDLSSLAEPLQHLWAIALAFFIIFACWVGYRIYYR